MNCRCPDRDAGETHGRHEAAPLMATKEKRARNFRCESLHRHCHSMDHDRRNCGDCRFGRDPPVSTANLLASTALSRGGREQIFASTLARRRWRRFCPGGGLAGPARCPVWRALSRSGAGGAPLNCAGRLRNVAAREAATRLPRSAHQTNYHGFPDEHRRRRRVLPPVSWPAPGHAGPAQSRVRNRHPARVYRHRPPGRRMGVFPQRTWRFPTWFPAGNSNNQRVPGENPCPLRWR
jgi:hypothetical protein